MSQRFDIDLAYGRGHTSKGTMLLTIDELLELTRFAKLKQTMIHTVEGYVLEGGYEVATPRFSLYGPDEGSEKLSWTEQIDRMENHVRTLTDEARTHPLPVMFQVWLDDKFSRGRAS
jgi:hypothetical protein